jgi:hypothetical protein
MGLKAVQAVIRGGHVFAPCAVIDTNLPPVLRRSRMSATLPMSRFARMASERDQLPLLRSALDG